VDTLHPVRRASDVGRSPTVRLDAAVAAAIAAGGRLGTRAAMELATGMVA